MARLFARASSEKITVGIGALGFAFGPGSAAAIVKKASTGVLQSILGIGATSGTRWSFGFTTADEAIWTASGSGQHSTTTFATTGWFLIAVTKATGTVKPRFHVYNFATNAWTHEDATATGANSGVADTSAVIGAGPPTINFFDGDIAVAGVWNIVLTDAEAENLPFNLEAWYAPAQPKALWILDQATTGQAVVDITGGGADQSAIVGTAVSVNSVPIWTPYGEVVRVVAQVAATPISDTDANGTTTEDAVETAAIPATDANSTTTETATETAALPTTDSGTASSEVVSDRKAVLTDSGTDSETATLAAKPTDTDSGTASAEVATQIVAITATDSGTSSEAITLVAVIADTDSGTSSEVGAVAVPISASDSGTGTDEIVAKASYTDDVGTGVDDVSALKLVTADSGTDSETATLTAALAVTDSGTSDEVSTPTAPYSVTDSGVGTDGYALKAVLADTDVATDSEAETEAAHYAVTDSGTASSENITVGQLYQVADSGTGTEVVTDRIIVVTDSGTASESVILHAVLADTDANDVTTEDETVHISANHVSDADSGSGSEAAALTANYAQTDSSTGSEVVSQLKVVYTDSGTADESATTAARLSNADSGTSSEDAAPHAVLTVLDTLTGTDAYSIAYLLLDTGAGSENHTLNALLLDSDNAVSTETAVSIPATEVSDTDSGVGTDDQTWRVIYRVTDTGLGTEVEILHIIPVYPIYEIVIARSHSPVGVFQSTPTLHGIIRKAPQVTALIVKGDKLEGIISREHSPTGKKVREYA